MSNKEHFDILVIGSGPGGQKAAVQGAKAGKKVALIERDRQVGGACVYRGTIPSKNLREVALTVMRLKQGAKAFDFQLREDVTVSEMMSRLDGVLNKHAECIGHQLENNGIEYIHGRAQFSDAKEVIVQNVTGDCRKVSADNIVIATGSRPRLPPDIPVDHENILDSDSILSAAYIPRSLTVLGGGVIACEYASIFSLLGSEVTIIDKAPRPLMFLDQELTGKFLDNFKRHGGTYLGLQEIESVHWDGASQVVTHLESGEEVRTDKMIVALGRLANTEQLGLENAGVETTPRGHVVVDKNYETTVKGVYAVGDVIGPPALASCSMEQGRRAMCHALDMDPGHPFELVPMGIYAVPEIASIGLNETQAKEQYGEIIVGRALYEEVARGMIAGSQDGLLKIIADKEGKQILGVQIVGESATDLIHIGEMAIINHNEVSIFCENVLNFPTYSEAYRVAALNILNQARAAVEANAPKEELVIA